MLGQRAQRLHHRFEVSILKGEGDTVVAQRLLQRRGVKASHIAGEERRGRIGAEKEESRDEG